MSGIKIPPGKRRCSDDNHEGERVLPESEFQRDRAQASGFASKCRRCRNVQARNRYNEDPVDREKRVAAGRRNHAAHTAAADRKDEAVVEEFSAAARGRIAKQERDSEKARIEAEKLRASAAARQSRLDSDFAALRADDFDSDDDFDTSVANDPKSKGLSKQAAAEKRQEFSRAMGQAAVDIRRAAVADMNGDGDLIGDMTPETGSYIGKLAEQERRFGNRRLARSISLFAAGEEQARRLWSMACRQYLTGRVVPTGYAAKGPSTRRLKRSVVLLLSDLHLGADLSGAENPMPFRKVEEARRLEYVMRQAIDYKPQYRSDSELVVLWNGDLIEGLLQHDFRDGAPLTEQKVVFQRHAERMMGEFARAFPKVRAFWQPGNHGRDKLRHPGRATSSKWDGHEWQMGYALMRACSALKNVTWDLPFRAICKVDLHGSTLGLTHGDTEVKLGDPDTKAKDNAQILDAINANGTYGSYFDAWAFGHFHKPRYLPRRIRTVFNGALVPPNGHARTSGYISESCGQYLWEAVEGHPIGDLRFIEVGREQDEDERLGTILEPFRFDLE
jgi:hypothetical protein